MKIAKFVSAVFGALGAVLMVGTVLLCLTSLNADVKVKKLPDAAVACTENLKTALESGDYVSAGNLMYGQPDLGADRDPADPAGVLVWDAFTDSISVFFGGECYATDSGLSRDMTVTTLDISSVTGALAEHAHALLTARVEGAEEMTELYDEENNFREELVNEVLQEAVVQALAEDAQTVTYDVTLNLIYRDGQWWVVPDQALLDAISGGVTRR